MRLKEKVVKLNVWVTTYGANCVKHTSDGRGVFGFVISCDHIYSIDVVCDSLRIYNIMATMMDCC